MPPCVEPSVCSQGPVSISHGEDKEGRGNLTRLVGRRRIFVQTDTGNVYGVELDRADNVQAVKKRLQALLHVPMDQAALVCGDLILKNDLSELKKDTPLLLTRRVQRSLSSPCLSPTSAFQGESGSSHVLEAVGGLLCSTKMRVIFKEVVKAVQCGVEPVPVSGGLGGAYYFRNSKGESIAIIKPTDEEPLAPNNPKGFVGRVLGQHGLKKAIRVGETGVREVAAYLLDHENFAKVPPTALVKITHHVFHVNSTTSAHGKPPLPVTKLASCQEFVCHDFDANDLGCSGFSVAAVHRIGILDIRIFNTDRHAGNILVKKMDMPGTWGSSRMHVNNNLELVPIDHGLCLPEFLEDPYFEWLHWPQASLAFSNEELDYIRRLDAKKDAHMLRTELPMLRAACLRVLILSTTFLKIAAAAGFCLAEIGALMSRDGLEEISQLEIFCLKAKQEAESIAMLEDDDLFSDDSYEGDDFQEQFTFEEDDELCENTVVERSSCSQNDSSRSHSADLSEPLPRFTMKEKSLASSGLSAEFESSCLSSARKELSSCCTGLGLEAHLNSPRDASYLKEEDFTLSLPVKQRTTCTNGGRILSRAVSISNSSGKLSSKSALLCHSSGSNSQFIAMKDEVGSTAGSIDAWQVSPLPAKEMFFKSASLSDRKPRLKFLGDRGAFGVSASEAHGKTSLTGTFGASASEVHVKTNLTGSASAFSFKDMSEQEWACFMDCFEQTLHEDFASMCLEPVGYRQRLGVSLPALRQTHFH